MLNRRFRFHYKIRESVDTWWMIEYIYLERELIHVMDRLDTYSAYFEWLSDDE